jgi:hypothetical protein
VIKQETSPLGQLVRLTEGRDQPNAAVIVRWVTDEDVLLDKPLGGLLVRHPRDLEVVPLAMVGSNSRDVHVTLTQEQATFLIANCDKNVTYALGVMMKAHGGSNGTGEDMLDQKTMMKLIELSQQFREIKQAIVAAGGSPPAEED